MRPWKAEQLGGGYAVSSWVERTAYEAAAAVIAVSAAMRADVLHSYPAVDPDRVHVVHNGIDTELWSPEPDPDRVRSLGVDPDRPSVVFVGRITRQKGLPLFLRAVAQLPPDVQVVLCAGAPDTPEIEAEVMGLVDGLRDVARRRRLDPRHAPPRRRRRAADRRDGVRLPLDLRAAGHRQPRGDGLRDRRRRHRDRRHPRGRRRPALRSRRRRRPGHRPAGADRPGDATAPAPRSTRTATSPTSPPRSPRSSPTPAGPPRWARPAASGRSTRSAGPRSPSGPWRSTARCSADRSSSPSPRRGQRQRIAVLVAHAAASSTLASRSGGRVGPSVAVGDVRRCRWPHRPRSEVFCVGVAP